MMSLMTTLTPMLLLVAAAAAAAAADTNDRTVAPCPSLCSVARGLDEQA